MHPKSHKRMKTLILTAAMSALMSAASVPTLADTEMSPQAIVEQADITVGLSGLVCDFCSLALNKTFSRSDAVAATYVDLDAKTLSIVFNDGGALTDAQITEMVKDAGYEVTGITRS